MINFKQDSNFIDVTSNPEEEMELEKPAFGDFTEPSKDSEEIEFAEPVSEIEDFAQLVLNTMKEESIPPTPSNYQLYFDRLLDEQSKEFKKHIFEIMEIDEGSHNSEAQLYQLESRLKEDINYIKRMLSTISTVFSNFNKMVTIAKKREKELDSITNPLAIQNVVNSLNGDLSTLSSVTKKQMLTLKELYTKSSHIFKEISEGSIFDQDFNGLYNQKYLLSQMEKESKAISQFNHNSTIVLAKLSEDTMKIIKNRKGLLIATKTVAKLFLKTSRRSDIIAHYGDGVFAMLLKYTDIENAKRATNRLNDLITSAHFFFDERDIELKVNIGIGKISPNRTTEETLNCVLEVLKQINSKPSDEFCGICPSDEEIEG